MTLSRAKVAGWADGQVFTPGEATHMDTEIVKAIDGAGGGAYAPTAKISIAGEGLLPLLRGYRVRAYQLTGNLTISDAFEYGMIVVPLSGIAADFTITLGAGVQDGKTVSVVTYDEENQINVSPQAPAVFRHPLGITQFYLKYANSGGDFWGASFTFAASVGASGTWFAHSLSHW